MTVFPGIGYTNADQSHFTSRHYWEVGELSVHTNTGWLGRLLDAVGNDDNPLQGLSLDGSLSPSLATARVPVAATWGARYDLWAPGVWGDVEDLMFESFGRLGDTAETIERSAAPGRRPGRAPGEHAARAAARVLRRDRQPGPLPGRGALLAEPRRPRGDARRRPADHGRVGRGARAATTPTTSRPTPSARISPRTCDGLLAFQRDLEARGLDDRVLTLVWSEFGRRPEENGDGSAAGTDHGAGGNAFLIGTAAKGTMVGEWPGLEHPRRGRQPARRPPTSAPSTARCSSSGSASIPRRSSRARRASPARP